MLRIQRGLLKSDLEHSWITTYLGKKPPTVRQDQAVSLPRRPRVLRFLVHELTPFVVSESSQPARMTYEIFV